MFPRGLIFNFLFAMLVLFPVVISFLFELLSLPVPAYLFVIIISCVFIAALSNNLLTISSSQLKLSFVLFFFWVLASVFYTSSVIASKEKFLAIVYNTILPIVVIELFFLSSAKKKVEVQSFEQSTLSFSYVLLWFIFLAFLLFRQPDESGRFSLPGLDNAIWFSRYIGMLFLIVVCCTKVTNRNIILFYSSIFIALVMLIGGGSRGPFLAGILVLLLKQSYFISKGRLLLLLIVVAIFITIGFVFIGGYLFETNFYSLYARMDLVKAFSNQELDIVRGSGIGSYALVVYGDDIVSYPHNIFLELFFENGMIGVLLFCWILFVFFKSFKPNIIYFLTLYYLIASLVSGDIPGNNNLFILLYISSYVRDTSSILNKSIIQQ